MDASLSHNPYAPDLDEATLNRWERVGATPDETYAIAPSFDAASVDDAALQAKLAEYRQAMSQGPSSTTAGLSAVTGQGADNEGVVEQDPTDGPATPPTEVDEAEALKGEWTPAEPIEIDGTSYQAWDLSGGWVVILVGDEHNGVHLVGYGVEGVTEKLRSEIHTTGEVVATEQGHANTEEWQAAKNLADAKARATA